MRVEEKSIDSALFLSAPGDWDKVVGAMKPGAHLLLFNDVKKHHAGTIAAEDNGLEIRDTVAWVYDSGGQTPDMLLVTVARKPLEGTVAATVLEHGTGALNIDGCRVGEGEARPLRVLDAKPTVNNTYAGRMGDASLAGGSKASGETSQGRWPANLIHDGSDEVVGLFPANAGASAPVKGTEASMASVGAVTGKRDRVPGAFHADTGSAARFFYSVPHLDDLLKYLLKLITPPGGTVLTNCNSVLVQSAYPSIKYDED